MNIHELFGARSPLDREFRSSLAGLATTGVQQNSICFDVGRLDEVLSYCISVGDAKFVAKVAVLAREVYGRRDSPAVLCAWLAQQRRHTMLAQVFPRVIDDGESLLNFCRIVLSSCTGRSNFGTSIKRLIANWLNSRTPNEILDQCFPPRSPSVDQLCPRQKPVSMRSLLRLARPNPMDRRRSGLYAWLLGKKCDPRDLPDKVRQLESWKAGFTAEPPDLPARALAGELSPEQWDAVAARAELPWLLENMGRLRLTDSGVTTLMCRFDRSQVLERGLLPHVVLAHAGRRPEVMALTHRVLGHALENVPPMPPAQLCLGLSASVLGRRDLYLRRRQTVALLAKSLMRHPDSRATFFDGHLVANAGIDFSADVPQICEMLAAREGKRDFCAVAIRELNERGAMGDLVVMVSENAWYESVGDTLLLEEWDKWKRRNPKARMICVHPSWEGGAVTQSRSDILNVGGFSDRIFNLINWFASGRMDKLVEDVDKVELNT